MNKIEIIREPCVDCPQTGSLVFLCECEKCSHFYGYNIGETKIGCEYEPVETGHVTANRETLLDNIEIALSGYGGELDLIEAGEYYDKTEARAVLGKALASLELLRAERQLVEE